MSPPLGRVIIYTSKLEETSAFYCRHFGFEDSRKAGDRIVELKSSSGGATLMLHPTGKGRKMGQTLVKLVFDVEDVPAFCARSLEQGLAFGPIHQADGYCFSNAKDPTGNSVSVSSRYLT